MKILCCGAGGFICGYLVDSLIEQGHDVVAVDIKKETNWFHVNPSAKNIFDLDLRDQSKTRWLVKGFDRVYNLAADMGGMNFIENNKAACMRSVNINNNLLDMSLDNNLDRYFYSSSACVYAADKQVSPDLVALKEEDAYPAMPEDGYGWEKLFSERMCRHYREDYNVPTRVARFHNIYGPRTSYDNLRGKAPARLSYKVIEAVLSGNHEIEIWGDGEQTRTFCYIDDCIKGINLITDAEFVDPVNLGSDELVSINQLVDIIEEIAGIKLHRTYNLDAPKGVRGRSSDNTLIQQTYGWQPSTSLREGLEKTYAWIYDEVKKEY